MKLKKIYKMQLYIDIFIIILGLLNYILPVDKFNINVLFSTEMFIYSVLEFIEYALYNKRKEPLLLSIISIVACFSAVFLSSLSVNYTLSIIIAIWTFMLVLTKLIALDDVCIKYRSLFIGKYSLIALSAMLGVIVSINVFYRDNMTIFMMGLLFLSFGFVEFIGDLLSYINIDIDFIA